ncbi:D-inositol-3-phosphate glycosyltransferase [uncultured archaeon]|nr:D-inositol-3-phosphate glycosyltransferase [uncultured archaeon]
MRILQIHQILPSFSYGDAIGNYALEIRDTLRAWGYESEIYAQYIHARLHNSAKLYTKYLKVSSPQNILIYHLSIGSDISQFVRNLPDKKVLLYHNITPPTFFGGINDGLAHVAKSGRDELKQYAGIVDLALGISEYNQKELIDLGFRRTGVLPIILDLDKYAQEPDGRIIKKFSDDFTNFIFVGRISPNKKQEDIIKIFYYYNKFVDPRSRLFLVGSYSGMDFYRHKLLNLIRKLELENVYITGQVEFRAMLAYYKLADVFISMSEHEGFCVPLLESMHFKIPIVAYNSTAIPYTLNGAGILINKKKYDEIAEMIYILVNDRGLRERIIQKQCSRLEDFKKPKIEAALKQYISDLIS